MELDPKGIPIFQPCERLSMEIGSIMMQIETLSRQPPSSPNASTINTLTKTLESLQNEYRRNCMPKG
jgi:hypothetical protein